MIAASFFHDTAYCRTLCGLQLIQSELGTLRPMQAVWSIRSISNEINFCLNSCHCSHCDSPIFIYSDKNSHCVFNTVHFFLP